MIAISPDALRAILQSEYRRRRMFDCPVCAIPPPVFRTPTRGDPANWTIEIPGDCPHHCQVVIKDALAEVRAKYDLKRAALA